MVFSICRFVNKLKTCTPPGGVQVILALMLLAAPAYASGVDVSTVALVDQDAPGNTWDIRFNLAWSNSWRDAGAPAANANWDAAWVFCKYSVKSGATWGNWTHCKFKNTDSVAPAGSTITFADNNADGIYRGAFVYRSANGAGTNTWNGVELRWDYGADGVADDANVKFKLFAIEMVYIPQGAFYIGDTNGDNAGNFKWQDGTGGAPQITSALGNAINAVDNAYDDAQLEGAGIRIDGDGGLDTDADGAIDNANFPTGYNPFYIMKYEVSQAQYTDFLNTLTRAQQDNRTAAQTANVYAMSNTANVNYRSGIRAPASIPAGVITFGNDLEAITAHNTTAGDGVFNETNDGQWVAADYLSWVDAAAYADWAGLRPFTELEFEKACRGPQPAVNDEYAWGNTTLEAATASLANSGANSELPNQGNMNYGDSSPDGPFRVGSFSDAASSRANAGASYFGVMELSGSLWERSVTVGEGTQGRTFDGVHGNGALSANGYADVSTWPGYDGSDVTGATGSGYRGGAWNLGATYSRVSDRYAGAAVDTARNLNTGARCARTAP